MVKASLEGLRRPTTYPRMAWYAKLTVYSASRREPKLCAVIGVSQSTVAAYIEQLITEKRANPRARPTIRPLEYTRGKTTRHILDLTKIPHPPSADELHYRGISSLAQPVREAVKRMLRDAHKRNVRDTGKKRRLRAHHLDADTEVKPDPNWRPPEEREDLGPTLFERLTKRL